VGKFLGSISINGVKVVSVENKSSLPRASSFSWKVVVVYAFKLLMTCAFLYWAFTKVDDQCVLVENFHRALSSPIWVVVGLAFAGMTVLAGAMRYHLLLKAQSIDVSFAYICKLSLIAALFNIVSLGVAAGDAVKMIGVMRRVPQQKITITMVVLMDHLVGFVSGSLIFLIFAWGGGIIGAVSHEVVRQVLIYGTAFELGALLLVVLMFITDSEKRLRFFRAKLPKLAANQHVMSVADAVHVFQAQKKVALQALVVSVLLSLSYFMSFYAALRTVDTTLPVSTVLTVMPVVDVASSLPISISGLGVREKTFEFFLSEITSVSTSAAISASLIGFLFQAFWGLVGGGGLVFERSIFLSKKRNQPSSRSLLHPVIDDVR